MPNAIRIDPHEEFSRRMEMRRASAAQQDRLDLRIGILRLIVFCAPLVIAWLSLISKLLSGWWLLLPAGIFLVLLHLHDRIRMVRTRLERAAAYYRRGIDRFITRGEQGIGCHDTVVLPRSSGDAIST